VSVVVRLTLEGTPPAPVDGTALRPGRMEDLDRDTIAALPARVGTEAAELGDLFRIEAEGRGDDTPPRLVLEGDLGAFEGIGRGMEQGELVVDGDAGDHLGAGMSGGRVTVRGSAGGWCGAEMTGGTIRVEGDVGQRAAAAYPGSKHGMNRGVILVGGDAGPYLGETMRRGLVAVRGEAGRHAGAHLVAGSLFLLGGCSGPPGAAMRRGTILVDGDPELLPGFRHACTYRPPFLPFYWRRLRERYGFAPGEDVEEGPYRRYSGDFTELGRGEVLVLDR
jgi:formylmethanofuran dehydrogenase subunit C